MVETSLTKRRAAMSKKKLRLRFVGLQPRTVRAYRLALAGFENFLNGQSVAHFRPNAAVNISAHVFKKVTQSPSPGTC